MGGLFFFFFSRERKPSVFMSRVGKTEGSWLMRETGRTLRAWEKAANPSQGW